MRTVICNYLGDFIEYPGHYKVIDCNNICLSDFATWKNFCHLLTVSKVESIHLTNVHLKAHDALVLGEAIGKCRCLRTMSLSENKLGNEGVCFIAKGIARSTSIKNIYVRHNKFDDIGFRILLEGLKCNKSLNTLHLWNNNSVTEDGLIELALFLKRNSNIVGLSVTSFHVTRRVRNAFLQALKQNYMLEEFVMENTIHFPYRSQVRSFMNENKKSFERIASEFVNYLLRRGSVCHFPPVICNDLMMEILSFFTLHEKQVLLEVNDVVFLIKRMILGEALTYFDRNMMNDFFELVQLKGLSRKETFIVKKLVSVYSGKKKNERIKCLEHLEESKCH